MKTIKHIAAWCGYEILLFILPITAEIIMVWYVVTEFLNKAADQVAVDHHITIMSPESEKIILVAIGTQIVHKKGYRPIKRFINTKIVRK